MQFHLPTSVGVNLSKFISAVYSDASGVIRRFHYPYVLVTVNALVLGQLFS